MLQKSLFITLLVIALTPVSFLVANFIASRSFILFKAQAGIRGKQTGLIDEMIGNERLVKAFGYEERASARFAGINEELQKSSVKALFFSSLVNPSTRAVNNVIYAVVALAGAARIMSGALTVGGLSVLLAYANQYMKPFNDISSVITELQNALACAGRLFALIEEQPQKPDAPGELLPVKGQVVFQDVRFSYDRAKPLIEDFSLKAAPGTRVAIVGPTGCGKTTLINLLMRFYDADGGEIGIDGQSIYDVTRSSLRQNFGMVLIFDDDMTETALLDRLDTVLTQDSLSQGEKQLLCITRVMLSLPPMLILDEATSSIDTRTEMVIQEAFEKLMKGRTSFVVAHRLSTIRTADIILVMKDGHIIEQGRHEDLLARGGFYAALYRASYGASELS